MRRFSISDFSMLLFINNPSQGLIKLNCFGKFLNWIKVQRFLRKIPNQPSFFISRENWDLLANGQIRNAKNDIVKWIPEGFEVFGFVFCVAFNSDVHLFTDSVGKAYFRIRTLLKKTSCDTIIVEEKNIAYVDVFKALKRGVDCLKFIDASDSTQDNIRDIIDTEIIVKNKFSSKIPKSFNDKHLFFNNEGGIFAKERIWDTLLLKCYNEAKGTLITLTWSGDKPFQRIISFDFKINGQYNTNLPCPIPEVCTSPPPPAS